MYHITELDTLTFHEGKSDVMGNDTFLEGNKHFISTFKKISILKFERPKYLYHTIKAS